VKKMKSRSVIIDVAIDQGGCSETSRPTSHDVPTYLAEGVLHYCVPNMPGAYGRTSTLALTNVTLNYVRALAQTPLMRLLREFPGLAKGIQAHSGHLLCRPVAEAQSLPCVTAESVLTR
jgi:alanine dehydrogenase